jgi:hypothetical protein
MAREITVDSEGHGGAANACGRDDDRGVRDVGNEG